MLTATRKGDGLALMESIQGHKRGLHSEFAEPSRHSLGTLKIGRSRVQAADHVDPQQVPLTGYEHFRQELQTYPVSREPVTIQLTAPNNSAILDLPNANMNLPPPLTPHQMNQVMTDATNVMPQSAPQAEGPIVGNPVSSNEILESIQSIAKVMQQQLLFSSKTAEQGSSKMPVSFKI